MHPFGSVMAKLIKPLNDVVEPKDEDKPPPKYRPHTEKIQTEATPEHRSKQASPELETWTIDDTTYNPDTKELKQVIESPDLERGSFGSVLSNLSKIQTSPNPWNEDEEREDEDKPPPKYRGPSR